MKASIPWPVLLTSGFQEVKERNGKENGNYHVIRGSIAPATRVHAFMPCEPEMSHEPGILNPLLGVFTIWGGV